MPDDAALGASLLVVLGHEECGAAAAAIRLVDDAQVPPGHIRALAERIVPSVRRARQADTATADEIAAQHSRYTVDLLRQRSSLLGDAVTRGALDPIAARYALVSGLVTEAPAQPDVIAAMSAGRHAA